MITAYLALIFALWLLLIVSILLQTRAEKRRAEMHLAALRRLQRVADPGALS